MTTTISMLLPYLGEISYIVRREMQRLVHCFSITPFQFHYIHESNKLKKAFTYKDKQNNLRLSSVIYKLTCTCASNYIGQTRRNLITRINEHKFDQRSEVCKHLLANPTHRCQATGNIGKHRRSEGTSPTRVSSDTAIPARSQRRWFILPLSAFNT